MTVRLRPHHLLCLLTYSGKGYSSSFVANYDRISKRLSDGEDILIVEGPDDICAPLLDEDDPHCWGESVRDRDGKAAQDVGQLLNLAVAAGSRIEIQHALLHQMRVAFSEGQTRAACAGCEWSELCSAIADDDYSDVRIRVPVLSRI